MTQPVIFQPEGFPHDDATIEQLLNCAESESDWTPSVLCADAHLGYSMPIGGVVAYREHVSPSGVGFDIGCGNKAVRTNLLASEVRPDLPAIMDRIYSEVSFGMGRNNDEPVEHPVLDSIQSDAPMREVQALHSLAARQLGTVGAGNHYVDLFEERGTGALWIGVHFGSRGFGHKIASGFLAIAEGLKFDDRAHQGEMMTPPALIRLDSPMGWLYMESMKMAGDYAYAGRDVVCEKVLSILGAQEVSSVHNHHNYAWRETHYDEEFIVVRKGATPLAPGQRGFIGATMGEDAVIVEGVEGPGASESLYSAPHGAGRALSRTKAAGKRRKYWVNNIRDDGKRYRTQEEALAAPGAERARKIIVAEGGLINYKEVLADQKLKGIEVRGGAADEAPGAYKRLPEVLAAHSDYVEVVHTLRPIGVAMAGPNVVDHYKD